MPDDWWPLLEKHLAKRQQQPVSASKAPTRAEDDDLTIPGDWRRSHPVEAGGAA